MFQKMCVQCVGKKLQIVDYIPVCNDAILSHLSA